MLVNDVIGGRLRIDRILGVGGFGVVAAATHLELRQQVAIKMLKPEFTNDAEIVDRFLREARAVAQLRTEHVCRVFDVSRTDAGEPYIVMELLEGSDVGAMIRREPLPPHVAVDFIVQALRALAEAHAHGIVHRDLKPPNLFVTRRQDTTAVSSLVKVLDFGIAKVVDELRLTHSSNLLGSPQYMSPEQINTPRDTDARTDIWSIGVTLYHMLSRRLPFPSAQIAELCVMITTSPPAPLDVDPGLRAVIWRCLEKDRAARFQSAAELSAALAPYAQVAPRPMSGPPSMPQPVAMSTMATQGSVHAPIPASVPVPGVAPKHVAPGHVAPGHVAPGAGHIVSVPVAAKSRAPLFAVAAAIIVVGGIGGYFAFARKTASPAPAPVVAERAIDAAVAVEPPPAPAAPTTTTPAPTTTAPAPTTTTPAPTTTAPAPTTTAPAPTTTAPAPTTTARTPRPITPPAPPRPTAGEPSPLVEAFFQLEGRIKATPKNADHMPSLLQSATQMACALGYVGKARSYFAQLTDERLRKAAADACAQHHVSL